MNGLHLIVEIPLILMMLLISDVIAYSLVSVHTCFFLICKHYQDAVTPVLQEVSCIPPLQDLREETRG